MNVAFCGRMSTFGGPDDAGVRADEGLALVNVTSMHIVQTYFLDEQPSGTTGLARRLNPSTFYVACRWDYKKTAPDDLLRSFVRVRNPRNDMYAYAKPIDWGPNANTGRVADLSPGLARHLKLATDDMVDVTGLFDSEDPLEEA